MADTLTRAIFNKVGGLNVRYNTWPALGGAGVAGIALTAGAGAWGTATDVVAAAAIATEFWACGGGQYTTATAENIQVYYTNKTISTSVYLFSYSFEVTATTLNTMPFIVQFPIYCAANSNIQAALGAPAAKSINVYLVYATGL